MWMEEPVFCKGSCHCGGLGVVLELSTEPKLLNPRRCDCSFCTKHGAVYLSDPKGQMAIVQQRAGCWHQYRQGSSSATFVLCSNCGVLVAVLFDQIPGVYGAVNLNCLNEQPEFGLVTPVSPKVLDSATRTERWTQLWFPAVSFTRFD